MGTGVEIKAWTMVENEVRIGGRENIEKSIAIDTKTSTKEQRLNK